MQVVVTNLTKTFGSLRANDTISISFDAGCIHGVLGENGAGKSTLMKLLSGFYRRDSGEVLLDGKPVSLDTPAEALQAGIGMVPQEPLDVPAFTALENFYCGSPPAIMPNIAAARHLLLTQAQALGFGINPDVRIGLLSVGQRQQLEIVRLLACGARVLILDEPTTGITAVQTRALFAALRRLAREGKTVLFVSHKLEEMAELCDTVTVLRSGRVMGAGQMPMPQANETLLTLMFGSAPNIKQRAELGNYNGHAPVMDAPHSPSVTGWRLEHVEVQDGPLVLHDLSLELRAGEVIGLAGLEGSGQQTLLRLLAGRLHARAGRIVLNGTDVTHLHARALLQHGVEYLPADRLAEGLIGSFSLSDHFALLGRAPQQLSEAESRAASNNLLVDWLAALDSAKRAIAEYNIKATPATPVVSLSGGNQQRALLSLLPEHCEGLLLEQPTRGLDLASAEGVWQRLLARRASGTVVVFASADLDEIAQRSDRVLVFFGGRVSPLIPRAELSFTKLGELIGGIGF